MIILDTSFIVSLLNKRDVHHSKAIEMLEGLDETEELAIHPLVLQETISVIARKCRGQAFICKEWLDKIEEFMSTLRIIEFSSDRRNIIDVMAKADCELSYIDAVLVLTSSHLRAPVLTFDKILLSFCKQG
ncbi:MAG: PIN domain-containing protein [Deltaproteobacteria bacterium]|nr:PIN domain-containing protein [Deltaproteobacteria bacterium]MBW2137014.1 PIN domain-containing protein [Deltaproteobacteria bacterium]